MVDPDLRQRRLRRLSKWLDLDRHFLPGRKGVSRLLALKRRSQALQMLLKHSSNKYRNLRPSAGKAGIRKLMRYRFEAVDPEMRNQRIQRLRKLMFQHSRKGVLQAQKGHSSDADRESARAMRVYRVVQRFSEPKTKKRFSGVIW